MESDQEAPSDVQVGVSGTYTSDYGELYLGRVEQIGAVTRTRWERTEVRSASQG